MGHVVVTAGDIMLIIITGVIVTVVVTRIMFRLLLLDRRHRGLNRREGGVQIWVVEVIFIGGNTLLCVSGRVLPAKIARTMLHFAIYLPSVCNYLNWSCSLYTACCCWPCCWVCRAAACLAMSA